MLKATNTVNIRTYVGYTNNLETRLNKHNTNRGAKSTKGNTWKVIFTKKFKTKSNAMSYEYFLKKNRKLRSTILKDNIDE